MGSGGRVETRGALAETGIEDGALILGGWAFSAGPPIDSLRVSSGDRQLKHADISMNGSSRDVAAYFRALAEGTPHTNPGSLLPESAMAQAANCRFRIRVPLRGANEGRIRTSILGITPLVGRVEGNLLLNVIEPFLPSPPPEFIEYIGGGYHSASVAILAHLIQWGGLRPDMHVLDVGCGVGRVAHSLVHYLKPTARYEGFDIAETLIGWAQENITTKFPHFRFRRVDLYNKFYNAGGAIRAADFRFPYEDESFDFVFSTSLFTHLLAGDARHYLDESYRVLRPGGRCFHTCFLLNEESTSLIRAGKSRLNLIHPVGECFTSSVDVPEDAIGFPEPLLLGYIAERGFTVREKYSGEWCGRPEKQFLQDVLIVEKPLRRRSWFFPRRAG